jgi:galactose mutarotase-like enzyme
MTTAELMTPDLAVRIDPARGGVISSAFARRAGVELLFQAPWPACPQELAGRDEEAWTTAWQGGWNVLFPNAGAACEVDGRIHPFHGAASFMPWAVIDQDDAAVRLRWASDDGLTIEREVSVAARAVRVENVVRNEGPRSAPFMLVEHLILGGDVLGASTRVRIDAAKVIELANEGHRTGREDAWPRIVRDGTPDDWSARPPDHAARYGALHALTDRALHVEVPERSLELRLSWPEGFPYLWFWEERAWEIAPPWNRRAVCLGLEPATSSTGEGLAAALERGDTLVLEPGGEKRTVVALEVIA